MWLMTSATVITAVVMMWVNGTVEFQENLQMIFNSIKQKLPDKQGKNDSDDNNLDNCEDDHLYTTV